MELTKRRTRRAKPKSATSQEVVSGTLGRSTPSLWRPHDLKRAHGLELVRCFSRWVHRCITINMQAAAAVRPRLYVIGGKESVEKMHWLKPKPLDRRTKHFLRGDARLKPSEVARKRLAGNIDDLTEVYEHPALDAFDNVNEWEEGIGFRESLYADLDMFGRSFTNIVGPKGGPPAALWRMLPHLTEPLPHPTKFISGFEYGRGTQKTTFAPEDVFWIKLHDPEDPWGGFGPLEAWLQTFYADFTMVAFQRWLFNRGGTPDVLIVAKGLTPDGRERLKADWRRNFGDMSAQDRDGVAILEGEGEVQMLSQKPREMEYRESRDLIRDEAGNAFGVPKSMLTTDDVNRANAEATSAQHISNTIWPRVLRVEAAINQRLLPLWSDRLVLIHENPLREDQAIVIQQRESKLRSGYSVNELRLDEGNEPSDDPMAEVPLIATGLVPLGNITEAGKPILPSLLPGSDGAVGTGAADDDSGGREDDEAQGEAAKMAGAPHDPPAETAVVAAQSPGRRAMPVRVRRAVMSLLLKSRNTPPPMINVAAPSVNIEPPTINVAAPNVHVEPPQIKMADVQVNVQPTPVVIENTLRLPERRSQVVRDRDGNIREIIAQDVGG